MKNCLSNPSQTFAAFVCFVVIALSIGYESNESVNLRDLRKLYRGYAHRLVAAVQDFFDDSVQQFSLPA